MPEFSKIFIGAKNFNNSFPHASQRQISEWIPRLDILPISNLKFFPKSRLQTSYGFYI